MSDSIFKSSVRSFFVTLSAMIALAIGLTFIVGMIGGVASLPSEFEVKTHYNQVIVPNAQGVRKKLDDTAPVILKINIEGMIGTELLNGQMIKRQLIESREGNLADNRVKAILVNVNTPGGTVTDSNIIYSALKEYKQQYNVPIYAFVDGMCASGGMMVSCACDGIYATESSIVGSVGVLSQPFFNVVGLMEKVGVEAETIYAGKDKDAMNPFRKWKENEDQTITSIIDGFYMQFVNLVTTSRPQVSEEKLVNEYGAKAFLAQKAKEIGFIDEIVPSSNSVLKLLAKQIGAEEDTYQVVQMESKFWLSNIVNAQSPLLTGKMKHQLETTMNSPNELLYLYSPTRN